MKTKRPRPYPPARLVPRDGRPRRTRLARPRCSGTPTAETDAGRVILFQLLVTECDAANPIVELYLWRELTP